MNKYNLVYCFVCKKTSESESPVDSACPHCHRIGTPVYTIVNNEEFQRILAEAEAAKAVTENFVR